MIGKAFSRSSVIDKFSTGYRRILEPRIAGMYPRIILACLSLGLAILCEAACFLRCNDEESATPPSPSCANAAASSLDAYRQRIDKILPKDWSIGSLQNELVVTRSEKLLVGWRHANGMNPPDPPAITIDDKVYLPGKGEPSKTIHIDEGDYESEGDALTWTTRPMSYYLFEPVPGQPVPKTRNDVSYRHEKFVITIRFLPLITIKDYNRLIEAKKAAKAKAEAMRKQLQLLNVSSDKSGFRGRTPKEKESVEQYEKELKESSRPLPRFHTDDNAVEISDTLSNVGWSYPVFANEQDGKHAESIRLRIEKMFTRYPPAD